MNIAVVFAGGTGQRMNTKALPKQFLKLHGKPILVYTLEKFQYHKEIDSIILVVLAEWKEYCKELITKYQLTKVTAIVSGGKTGQESISNGLHKAGELYPSDSIVLIHDGVRPLVDEQTITNNIACAKQHGTAITVAPAIETIVMSQKDNKVGDILERSRCQVAKAPQSFVLGQILAAHEQARKEARQDFIDSACLMKHYGYDLYTVEGKPENIKITTPSDFYTFRALVDAIENSQIMGL